MHCMSSPESDSRSLELFRKNKIAVRTCILYEYDQEKSVYESYLSFCDAVGDDFMEYREFDFWYYKLGKEGIELDSDLEWDPETISLSDMPMELTASIVEFLDPSARVTTRAVSRNFRDIVDRKGPVFEHAKLLISPTECSMNFESELSKRLIHAKFPSETSTPEEIAEIEKAKNIAFDEMARIIGNPKLELEDLRIMTEQQNEQRDRANITEVLNRVFKPTSTVSVGEFEAGELTLPEVALILSHLKAGKLDNIRLSLCEDITGSFDTFIQSEQFKKARAFTFIGAVRYSFPIEALFHLENFFVPTVSLSVQDVIKIRDVLLQSVNFDRGFIRIRNPNVDVIELVRLFDPSYSGERRGKITYLAHNFIFDIEFTSHRLRIEKRATNSYY